MLVKGFISDHFTRFSVPPPKRAWFALGPMWDADRRLIGAAITIGRFHAAIHRRIS